MNAAARWTSATNNHTQFVGWGQCTPYATGIKIHVGNSEHPRSYVGTSSNGMNPSMHLNFFTNINQVPAGFKSCAYSSQRDRCIIAIATHEFGHALGFLHEQDSPLTPNECKDQLGGHQPQTWLGNLTLGNQWDAQSVMNYCHNMYANTGLLSHMDKLAVKTWYGNMPYIRNWDGIVYIPVIKINGNNHALKLKNNSGVFSIIDFHPSNQTTASEAIMNGNSIHVPYMKFLPDQNDEKFVSEIFDVWMEYHPTSNTITISTFEVAR